MIKLLRSSFTVAVLASSLLAGMAVPAQEQENSTELVVAAAADLSSALKEIAAEFAKKTGTHIKLSFGSSGMLMQEILNGAPFDVFFSADMDYPQQLITAGAADSASLYQYALGKLVLWVPADSPLDVTGRGMSILLDSSVKKISIANPQHAPYGRAAVAALKHAGLYDRVAEKLVTGENVSQAAQFVESGNAQAGFIALAHAIAPGMQGKGKYWQVPVENYPPLKQGVVSLSRSPHKKAAAEFLMYVRSQEAAAVLNRYGFTNR